MNKSILFLTLLLVSCSLKSSGMAYSIGNTVYYNDNNGDNYTMYSIGNTDYISGSNGYSGYGYSIGNCYYFQD